MRTYTVRYRDFIGHWAIAYISASDEYAATQTALARGIFPYSVS